MKLKKKIEKMQTYSNIRNMPNQLSIPVVSREINIFEIQHDIIATQLKINEIIEILNDN